MGRATRTYLEHCRSTRDLTSCRFVVVSVLNNKQQTPVSKRNVNPTYPAKEATFDFPIYLSLAEKLGVIELVLWDKDVLRKDYLGEVSIPLDDWFRDDNAYPFDDPNNKVSIDRPSLCINCAYIAPAIHVQRCVYTNINSCKRNDSS